MSLSKGIGLEVWNSALQASIAVLTAEVHDVDVPLDLLLRDVDASAVVAMMASQLKLLLSLLGAEASERLLKAWGVVGTGAAL
jgi:hypothetical protein